MRRILAVILATAMLLSVCVMAQAEGEKEHLDISVGNWDQTEFGNDPIGKIISEKFNMSVEILNEDWGNYEEQIALWGSSDELPDVFCGYVDETWFGDFIDQELLADIPVEKLEQYPNLYDFWKNDSCSQAMYDYYGKIYYISRNDGMDVPYVGSYTGGMGLYYRKDWAQKLNIAEPTDMDQLLEMLTAFAQQDPDGDGQANTYGLDTTFGRLEGLWSWFNCYPGYWIKTADGYMPGYLDKENMLDALTWLRKAYESGAIDPEWQGDVSGFADGTFGAYTYHTNPGWASNIIGKFAAANPDLGNAYDVIGNLTCLPAHAGEAAATRPYFCDGITVFAYSCEEAKMDRMLAFLDWCYSDEGWMLTMYGIEGEFYNWDADGNLVYIEGATYYPSNWLAHLISWGGNEYDAKMASFAYMPEGMTKQDCIDYSMKLINAANEACKNPEVTFDMVASLISTEEKSGFMLDWKTGLMEIVTGTDTVEAMYDQFVKDAYDYDVQGVMDSVTAAMA